VKPRFDLVGKRELVVKTCYFVLVMSPMNYMSSILRFIGIAFLLFAGANAYSQANSTEKKKRASKKVEVAFKKDNKDTLAQGYFDLGETYYHSGDIIKSENYYKKARDLFERVKDADGVAKSSRALAIVQEDLKKTKEAIGNYNIAKENSRKIGDVSSNNLNDNDIDRLSGYFSIPVQQRLLQKNVNIGILKRDTNEIVTNYSRLGDLNLKSMDLRINFP
jgi:tetratricopeptide (TPR) repeat protein